jgi:anti-sigma B factor antagonist
MEIGEKQTGKVNIVSISGRLDASSASELEARLNSLLDSARSRLVVDFTKLDYISSSGLRVLLAALKKARRQQGDVKLSCLKPGIKEVFDIAGFSQLFTIVDTPEAAQSSFTES